MKILVSPDSFKGTLTAIEVSEIVGEKLSEEGFSVFRKPIADGGDGTIDIIEYAIAGRRFYCNVKNPLREAIETFYLSVNDTVYLEYAKTSGIILIPRSKLNPVKATSFGFGELIKDAINKGFKKIVLTIGGSATNDAGIGMLQALGAVFYDDRGNDISDNGKIIIDASCLKSVKDIDISGLRKIIEGINFTVLSDVNNPLTGHDGATYVFGKQKGAKDNELIELEAGMLSFSETVRKITGSEMNFPGAGAAGGVGSSLKIFLGAEIKSGIAEIIKLIKIEEEVKNSDFVITGEGSMDFQTAYGKAPYGIASLAKRYLKPVIGIAGKSGKNIEELLNKGFDCIICNYGDVILEPGIIKKYARENLKLLSGELVRILKSGDYKNKIFIINR